MIKTTKLALSMLAAAAMALSAHAVPLTGSIGFSGIVTMDTSDVGTASEVVNWYGPTGTGTPIAYGSADFAVLNGLQASISHPWSFDTTSTIKNFWTVGSFTFDLTSSSINVAKSGNGVLYVTGTGFFNAPGYDQTAGTWTFSTQNPSVGSLDQSAAFTFSSSDAAVPEAGTTAVLLGCGLMGLFVFAKFRKQAVA